MKLEQLITSPETLSRNDNLSLRAELQAKLDSSEAKLLNRISVLETNIVQSKDAIEAKLHNLYQTLDAAKTQQLSSDEHVAYEKTIKSAAGYIKDLKLVTNDEMLVTQLVKELENVLIKMEGPQAIQAYHQIISSINSNDPDAQKAALINIAKDPDILELKAEIVNIKSAMIKIDDYLQKNDAAMLKQKQGMADTTSVHAKAYASSTSSVLNKLTQKEKTNPTLNLSAKINNASTKPSEKVHNRHSFKFTSLSEPQQENKEKIEKVLNPKMNK